MTPQNFQETDGVAEVVLRDPIDSTRTRWVNRVRSADHKVIGTTLIGFSGVAVVIGAFAALLCWAQLITPDSTFLTPERFYTLHTISDTSFLYLFALPLFAGIAIYVLPLQIGARSTAFPRLSALGAWMIVFGGVLMYASFFVNTWQGGASPSAPLTSLFYSSGAGFEFWLSTTMLVAGGLTAIAIDLAVTYKIMRADGMSADNTPVFAFTTSVFSYGILATAPVLIAAGLMMLLERQYEIFGIFNTVDGGNALLWKTLFQWWSHSAPYLVLLMAAGAISEILPVATRTALANRDAVKKALQWFAVLAILGFGKTYFTSPVAPVVKYVFMVIGLSLLVPSVVLLVSWLQTLRAGNFSATAPSLFALVFVAVFAFATVDNVALSLPTLSASLAGSQFGYSAWLNMVWGGAVFGGFAALFYWFPKMTGRSFDPAKAKVALGMLTLGSLIAILSIASLGVDGLPREVSEYSGGYQTRHIEAAVGMLIAFFGLIGVLLNFVSSSSNGAQAGNDPWHADTLEWFVPSPPPANNFDAIPNVKSDAPLADLRERIVADTGDLAGSVAQSPTSGRPSLRESKH
ncbi:MAG: cbb3-type cytochrome c oxidase subunit I [Solirubrobacterales bacterium]